ncbi:MAG: alkyl sulfatase dimerization domain-containing protein [Pseudomonadales bacterium]|jgi:alkyl sulfatase BDS1-like metallo-beta-lactamase superfamily hydrolase|nr:alkyl sulfatase dimerization domain-containing protein [Pseudomonadales bacterium]
MADLLTLSAKVIDEGVDDGSIGPLNRINHELSVIADDIAMVEAFSHSIVFRTDAGLAVFDTSGAQGGSRVVDAIRGWTDAPFDTVVYTHGHVDHVGGSGFFAEDAAARRHPVRWVGHENVPRRFDRYRLTDGYNRVINERQFGNFKRRGYGIGDSAERFLPAAAVAPDTVYRDTLALDVGGLELSLRHARGETDDHSWAWIPEHRAICAGDFFIWNFPNAGNPQKVQRYPLEWARAMRSMMAMDAELFLPAHGLPIQGRDRIRRVLGDVADTLEQLVGDVLALMNEGETLDTIIHEVRVAPEVLERPWMRPMYDEPEFVIRNVWRLYGGWWDGNPSRLKPAPDAALAREITTAAGGAGALAKRALELADADDLRLACHLIDFAALAEPDDGAVHALRAEIYQRRRNGETSLMAKGIFASAANASRAKSPQQDES